jgi:hypothetical protein
MDKLQGLGYIPTNQVFNQSTFDIYVMPIYDQLIEKGHIEAGGYNAQDLSEV